MMAKSDYLQNLLSFVTDNGFIWGPSPEIYGGVAGFYDYGPLGKLLKNNIENAIRKVFSLHHFWEVECPTVMPEQVWKASGHLSGFNDPLILCSSCSAEHRVDKLLEESGAIENAGGLSDEESLSLIKKNSIKCQRCNSDLQEVIKKHSLMMQTTIGTDTVAFNRPETATTTYLPFKRYDDFFRHKFPFGVFQIGKAYRNEISPRQAVMRGREFTQAEGQLFIFKDQKNNFPRFDSVSKHELPLWFADSDKVISTKLGDAVSSGQLKNKAYAWTLCLAYDLFVAMGIPTEKIRMRQHGDDEKAFYAEDAWDIEIYLNSFGWYEVCGVHDRTDYDLTQHAKASGKKLTAFNENSKQQETPHIIEIAFGTDRPTFALLDIFYDNSDINHKIFRIPANLAPVQVGVFPLVNKVSEKAKEVFDKLHPIFRCKFDSSGAIGRRYYRADEEGIPFCITVDFETLEQGTVTIRRRDTGEQTRVSIESLAEELQSLIE